MKLFYWSKTVTALTFVSVCIASFQLIYNPGAVATPVNSKKQPTILAQNNAICSFISANNVNIRSGPGTQHNIIAKLNLGDGVRAVVRKGSWVQISGRVTSSPGVFPEVVKPLKGWVLNSYINGCSEDQFDRWRR